MFFSYPVFLLFVHESFVSISLALLWILSEKRHFPQLITATLAACTTLVLLLLSLGRSSRTAWNSSFLSNTNFSSMPYPTPVNHASIDDICYQIPPLPFLDYQSRPHCLCRPVYHIPRPLLALPLKLQKSSF